MTPAALTLTVPLVTAMVCAVPGVMVVPLILCTVRVSPSPSVSFANRLSTVGVSSTIGNGNASVPSSTATGGRLPFLMVPIPREFFIPPLV